MSLKLLHHIKITAYNDEIIHVDEDAQAFVILDVGEQRVVVVRLLESGLLECCC